MEQTKKKLARTLGHLGAGGGAHNLGGGGLLLLHLGAADGGAGTEGERGGHHGSHICLKSALERKVGVSAR